MKNSKIFKIFISFCAFCVFIIIFFKLLNFGLSVNISPSLPFKVFFIDKRISTINGIKNGNFIQFINDNPKYYNGKNITKYVLASSGDVLDIYIYKKPVNNIQAIIKFNNIILKVKDKSILGTKIYVNNKIIVPKDSYFVVGFHENSFDSRYQEFGFINKKEIIGVAKPLF